MVAGIMPYFSPSDFLDSSTEAFFTVEAEAEAGRDIEVPVLSASLGGVLWARFCELVTAYYGTGYLCNFRFVRPS
jgi:hypothetical protein